MSILNSVIITAGAIVGLVLLGSVAAYVITRRTRAWTNVTFYLVLIAIILPAQLGTVPLYIGARTVGLTGNAIGMILLWIGILLPLSVFLYASFFRGLTTEYEEAAVIDGASPTQAFFRVVLPLMAPATGTVAILAGLIVWNDFFNSLIFLGGSRPRRCRSRCTRTSAGSCRRGTRSSRSSSSRWSRSCCSTCSRRSASSRASPAV